MFGATISTISTVTTTANTANTASPRAAAAAAATTTTITGGGEECAGRAEGGRSAGEEDVVPEGQERVSGRQEVWLPDGDDERE